jgi:hypothetical protein
MRRKLIEVAGEFVIERQRNKVMGFVYFIVGLLKKR